MSEDNYYNHDPKPYEYKSEQYTEEEKWLIVSESDQKTSVTVPLVVYIGGVRHVIGEATVKGNQVITEVGPDVSDEIMDQLVLRPDNAHFSIGFDEGPNPFRKKPFIDESPNAHFHFPKTEFNKKYDGPILRIDKEKADE